MTFKQGQFAFDNVTDRGAKERAEHLTLPKLKKACKEGVHLYSDFVRVLQDSGFDEIVARCPDCQDEVIFPAESARRNS